MRFELQPKQVERFNKWATALTRGYENEDCSGMSPFTFSFTETGIGPVVKVSGFGQVLSLTLDDDNEFC